MTLEEAIAKVEELAAQLAAARVELTGARAEIAEVRVELAEAKAINAKLMAENQQLRQRVEELERKLGQNSQNSSKPPSSNPPWAGTGKGLGAGGKGRRKKRHRGARRSLLPESEVTRLMHFRPPGCGKCGSHDTTNEGEPRRFQTVELPKLRADVTEYRCQDVRCDRCHAVTRAPVPQEALESPFGPRLSALVGLLLGPMRLSRRQVQEMLGDVFGVSMSLGGIVNVQSRVSDALSDGYDEACGHVKSASVVYADETPWKIRHRLAWMWTAGAARVITFHIAKRRTGEVAREVLSEAFLGTLVSDRYGAYSFIPMDRRQVCWAHLKRELVSLSEQKDPVARYVGQKGVELVKKMCELFGQQARQEVDRESFVAQVRPVTTAMEQLLELGAKASHAYPRSKCKSILKSRQALFTFVDRPGVEPTNNRSERALRHAVIHRKISLGTQSEHGCRFVERIQTAFHSLRAQGRNVYQYLLDAMSSHADGAPCPSLLPC